MRRLLAILNPNRILPIISFVLVSACVAAIAIVGSGVGGQTTASKTNNKAVFSTNTSGNFIALLFNATEPSTAVSTVADTKTNSYGAGDITPYAADMGTTFYQYSAMNIANSATPNTVTITIDDYANYFTAGAGEFSGIALTGALDKTCSNQTTGTSVTCNLGTLSQASELVVAQCSNAAVAPTPGSGWSTLYDPSTGDLYIYKIVSSTTDPVPTCDASSSSGFAITAASYKAAAGEAPSLRRRVIIIQ